VYTLLIWSKTFKIFFSLINISSNQKESNRSCFQEFNQFEPSKYSQIHKQLRDPNKARQGFILIYFYFIFSFSILLGATPLIIRGVAPNKMMYFLIITMFQIHKGLKIIIRGTRLSIELPGIMFTRNKIILFVI